MTDIVVGVLARLSFVDVVADRPAAMVTVVILVCCIFASGLLLLRIVSSFSAMFTVSISLGILPTMPTMPTTACQCTRVVPVRSKQGGVVVALVIISVVVTTVIVRSIHIAS